MRTVQETVVQHLHEAHALERTLAGALSTQLASAPPGGYRSALDEHLRETRAHADAIARRLEQLGAGPDIVARGPAPVRRLAGLLATGGRAALTRARGARVRGASREQRLLRGAQRACAGEALEIATYDALEALARLAGDEATAALAVTHRADEERMLETLTGQLPGLAAAAVGAVAPAAGGAPSPPAAFDAHAAEREPLAAS
jgi:ferritin-like metal-binding protein YciE